MVMPGLQNCGVLSAIRFFMVTVKKLCSEKQEQVVGLTG
jgi:hypothetical protein